MNIFRHGHAVFQPNAVHRHDRAACADRAAIPEDEARAACKIRHGKAAACRPMHMHVTSDRDAFGTQEVSPRRNLHPLAARIQRSLYSLRLRRVQIRVILCKKLRMIGFFAIERDIPGLIGAPDILRQGCHDPAPCAFKRQALCQHGVILRFINLIPRKICLRCKERRQDETDIRHRLL